VYHRRRSGACGDAARRLVLHGWRNVATRWPRDAQIIAGCLRKFRERQSPPAFEYDLRP
jgi:hypothetical protein